ncbi:MAG: protein kinase [Deltaproteobacteria bacterium]|nr:protein kinase [Deltaproteobacteria bacterium]
MGHPPPPPTASEPDDTTQVGPVAELRRDVDAASTRGDVLGDRYQILAVIGSGGGGVVFRARDRVSGALVAVKTAAQVDVHTSQMFEREARVLASLRHAAIVKYLDHGLTAAGAPYLVMELLAGENLRERLNHGPLEPAHACLVMARMLDALGSAHARGVVHRDFKPSNVFLPGGDLAQAKLLDFGVAREVHGWMRTLTGQVMGTPLYMAPEQALGQKELDGRADVFAVGCVLVECITGRPVFAGAGSAGLAKLALADSVVPADVLDVLPSGLPPVVSRMLSRAPEDRPADALALAAQLRAVAESVGTLPAQPVASKSLGAREARPVMVLMVGPGPQADTRPDEAKRLQEVVARWGGEAQVLLSGSSLVTFGVGGARELAVRAARAALELRSVLAGRAMALALGRATVEGRVLVGAAIDETTRLVALSPAAASSAMGEAVAVYVDADTAELLSEQFSVLLQQTEAGAAYQLVGEIGANASSRLVMGRQVPFVGRERELRSLEALVTECFDEPRCGAALILAPAGAGKSRLRRELLRRLQEEDDVLLPLVGVADAFRAGAPYEILGAAFKQAAQVVATDSPGQQSAKLEDFLALSAPTLAGPDRARVWAFLGEIAGLETPSHLIPLVLAARQDPRTMADQVRVAWLDWLAAALMNSRVLLVLEDLHWGDAPSIALVDAAMKAYRTMPLVVMAFARPEVNARFPNLWRDTADRITLSPLRARAARELIKAVLPELSDERAQALIERADGNPFFLEELVRVEAVHGGGAGHATPPTVLAAVQGRLDQVGDAGKRVLRAASVFGEGFVAGGVAALLPAELRADVVEWLDVLSNAELIMSPDVRTSTGEVNPYDERWQFRHALVKDAAYDTLTDVDRRVGHKLAAFYLQDCGERDGVVLASHFERAGETQAALVQWRVAAEQALDASDFEGVFDRCARAHALGPQDEELGRLHLVACRAHMYRGDWPAGEEAARKALEWLRGDLHLEALRELTISLGHQQKFDLMRQSHQQLLDCQSDDGASHQWTYAVLQASGFFLFLNEPLVVISVLENVREVALGGDLRLRAMWYSLRTHLHLILGKAQQSIDDARRALELFHIVGDLRESCGVLNNLVCTLTDVGQLQEAEKAARDLIALSRRLGGHYTLLMGQVNLAATLLCRRQNAEARQMVEEALAGGDGQNDPRVVGFCSILLAQAALAEERGDLALARAEEAVSHLAKTPSLLFTAEAALARALLMVGRGKDARIYAESAVATLRRLGGAEHAEFLVWLAGVECLRAEGDMAQAREVAAEALVALEKRLSVLQSQDDRERVLASLPDVGLLARQAHSLGLKFPAIPEPRSPHVHLKTGTDWIRGES